MKVRKIYWDTHMGLGIATLQKIAGKALPAGECAVFINSAGTAAKILYTNDTIIYWRPGRKITSDELLSLPDRCRGSLKFSARDWGDVLSEFRVLRKAAA